MKNKILIIGQAPPAVKQSVPYDTTLLYDVLSWVGINKEQAKNIFEFEAVSNEFPGHGKIGHLKPSKESMNIHWENTLRDKFKTADKVIILGNVAAEYIESKIFFYNAKVLKLIHPSKRNFSRIVNQRENITKQLKEFINDTN